MDGITAFTTHTAPAWIPAQAPVQQPPPPSTPSDATLGAQMKSTRRRMDSAAENLLQARIQVQALMRALDTLGGA